MSLELVEKKIYNLSLMCKSLIGAVDHGEKRVWSPLAELVLNFIALSGVPIY